MAQDEFDKSTLLQLIASNDRYFPLQRYLDKLMEDWLKTSGCPYKSSFFEPLYSLHIPGFDRPHAVTWKVANLLCTSLSLWFEFNKYSIMIGRIDGHRIKRYPQNNVVEDKCYLSLHEICCLTIMLKLIRFTSGVYWNSCDKPKYWPEHESHRAV